MQRVLGVVFIEQFICAVLVYPTPPKKKQWNGSMSGKAYDDLRSDKVRYGVEAEDAFCAAAELLLTPMPQADQLPNHPCRHLLPSGNAGSNPAGLVTIAFAQQKTFKRPMAGAFGYLSQRH